jgi:hypothetical protein
MIELSMIRDLVAIFGVIAGFSYYVMTVQNARKNQQQQLETRQAQLFMNIYNTYRSKEYIEHAGYTYNMEYTDAADFDSKYGEPETRLPYTQLSFFFEGIGVLVEEGLIDINLVAKLISGDVARHWKRFGPYILERREKAGYPEYMEAIEYLFNEIVKVKPDSSQVKDALEPKERFRDIRIRNP